MKRGISLIAVLMFMLAATTASVVIFKWIGSENFSSGARLKASEAYQASESGIDYVRSWMENKAADVGALVTQYASTNPKPKSLKIFSDIQVGDKNQKFSAYLIGIDTTSKPILRLKILVEGSARDNSKVSQTAIFSTDGLYKIFIPAEIEKQKSTTDLNAYFGSDMKFDGNKRFSSATINGNWTGNPPKIDKDFIVTGNLTNSGNSIDVGNNACVGGEYKSNNDKVSIKGGLYMGKSSEFVGAEGSYQDVYCDGDLTFGTNGKGEMIKGSLTVNGKISGFNGGRRYRIEGSLVLGDTVPTATMTRAYIDGTGLDQGNSFVVCDSVWTTNPAGVRASQTQGEKINFNYGRKPATDGCPTSKPDAVLVFKDAALTTGEVYKTQPTSPVGYFKSPATNTTASASNKPDGASSIKEYCMKIFGKPITTGTGGCAGSKYKVDDPIATSLESIRKFLADNAPKSTETSGIFKCLNNTATNIRCQGDINTCGSNIKITNVLNNCYEKLKNNKDRLYGGAGGYLIVKLNQTESYYYDQNQKALDGKFIFIYEEPQDFVTIAPTKSTSKVMIFFEQGVRQEMRSSGCVSDGGGGYYKYNYFIYSLGDIKKTNNWGDKCPLEGNIFFPSSGCNRLHEADNNFSLESNKDLVDELMDMGIICKRTQGNTGDCKDTELSPPTDPDDPDQIIKNPEIRDNNWIPIAARLPIKLESKEISKEKAQTPGEFKKSILIMPRVIYLAPKQISKESDLSKYYAPLYLNGANTTPAISANSITCNITDFSAKKRYTCTFQGITDISNFHVIIDPNKDVASSPAVTALCKWDGRGKTMFTGQSKPSDPTIECSSGDPNVSS
ncbi:MAG: hypothetical protein FWF63_01855, partial [Fibromonadales bacterium]|nr:hypothetical protein [Fibromonadales bacterium]